MCFSGNDVNIDDFIDSWHESNSTLPLHEFLGLTETQYKQFVEGETISTILNIN